MTTRTELLNFLAKRYGLERYLEIGVQNPANNFDLIQCLIKTSVDPDPNSMATCGMTSDEYFTTQKTYSWGFDLIFIDGLHHADQAARDFTNSFKVLAPGGFIVLHDCNPPKEEYTHVPRDSKMWWGDVYKFASRLSRNETFCTVDIDCGCGVFKKTNGVSILDAVPDWNHFDKNRKTLLNLISAEEFLKLHA